MRRLFFALVLVTIAASASADDDDHELPLSIWAKPITLPRLKLEDLDFPIFSMHVDALPTLREPLPGSVPANTSVLPTAFALNHVSFPYKPGFKSATREKAEELIGKQE